MDTVDLRIKEVKNTMYNDLYHHGILGMKWGVRRYQSYDTVPRISPELIKYTRDALYKNKII